MTDITDTDADTDTDTNTDELTEFTDLDLDLSLEEALEVAAGNVGAAMLRGARDIELTEDENRIMDESATLMLMMQIAARSGMEIASRIRHEMDARPYAWSFKRGEDSGSFELGVEFLDVDDADDGEEETE